MSTFQAEDHSFPPQRRFHNGRDYGRVFHRQQKAAGRWLVVLVAPRPRKYGKRARLGIMVSTKVSKSAVRRHQLKRWAREYFRHQGQNVCHGYDVIVLFRKDPPSDGHQAVDKELTYLCHKALTAEAKPGSRK